MTLHLNQLVYTSFQSSGLQLLAGDRVSPDVQNTFMERIVEQYWDPSNPYEARYQAAYVHQVTPQDSFFGWVFNENVDQGYVPLFLCYHLEEPLTADVLKSIFGCLQQGPVKLVKPQGTPPQLASLSLQTLSGYSAARPGVSIPQDIQEESFAALKQDEPLSLFVPSLGADYAVPLEKDECASDLQSLQDYRQRLLKGGIVAGSLAAAFLGLFFLKMRPSTPVFTAAQSQNSPSKNSNSVSNGPLTGFAPPKVLPKTQPSLKRQPQKPGQAPSGQADQERQQALALQAASRRQSLRERQQAAALQAASRRQAAAQRLPSRSSGTVAVSSPGAEPEESLLDALRPKSSTARYATVAGVNLRKLGLKSTGADTVEQAAPAAAPEGSAPTSVVESAPSTQSPLAASPAPIVTAVPPQPAVGAVNDTASRLADIAANQELANVLSRGLVVANRVGDVPYRSSTYLKVQNVIRRLRLGENWSAAAQGSGISDTTIVALTQLAYDADLDAASVTIKQGVTTHDIANAISRGLVIADRSGAVRYRSHTYLKVQDVIHRLRLGQNRHFAASRSGVQQDLIEQLLTWGGLPPAAVVSFNSRQQQEQVSGVSGTVYYG
ncbi:hypothetical protein C1752_05029 [Acaryochloris thomasi RCC1774]|uniref:Uncharacterized protein n=1 Tax=Acaryochloris thomasi RCC1774 TaxID=1764569 RepID=A0A2W1JJB9_9CYAN|nr:hypothetical protein [Acaryochloris thomasi]PZD71595.1 hypothetical protein C1752_05029 [Acaryochloris thomasi RCC1774]